MGTIPTMITQKILFEKLLTVEEKLDKILLKEAEYSIEEISLNRAKRILSLGVATIIRLVKTGKLKARTYKDKNRVTHYRFRIADIRAFQKSKEYDHISLHAEDFETAEEIADRTFPGRKQKWVTQP